MFVTECIIHRPEQIKTGQDRTVVYSSSLVDLTRLEAVREFLKSRIHGVILVRSGHVLICTYLW